MKVKNVIQALNYSRRDYRKPEQFVRFYVDSDGRDGSFTMTSTDPHVKEYEDRVVTELWLSYNYEIDEPVLNFEVI